MWGERGEGVEEGAETNPAALLLFGLFVDDFDCFDFHLALVDKHTL